MKEVIWALRVGVLHSGSSRGFRVVPNTASVSFTTAPPSAPSPPPAPAGDALPPPAVFNVRNVPMPAPSILFVRL